VNGLVIRSPWVEMILDRKKIWEIRGAYTHVRGKIGLIRAGSGMIVGTCELIGAIGPLELKEFRKSARKAGLRPSEARTLPYQKTYAWVLRNPMKFRRPRLYNHPSGAVIWVKLRDR
jgi:hypothetical protein